MRRGDAVCRQFSEEGNQLLFQAPEQVFVRGLPAVDFVPAKEFHDYVTDFRIRTDGTRMHLPVFPFHGQGGLKGAFKRHSLSLSFAAVGVEVDYPVVLETVGMWAD
jgi:hypothetical protein